MILLSNLISKLPFLNKIFSSNNSFNLENIYFKIRIGIWCVTFTSTMISFFVENWTPKSAFIPFPLIYLFALYLLLTKKNEYILGLPMLVLLLSVTAGVLEKEGVYYLRMLTSCIGFVAIYSVMSYPFLLQIIMSGGYIFIQKRYRYHLSDVYEPITNTYRISANSINDALDGWQASLIMQFITLMVYQMIVKKIWKNYKEVKDRLEQTNIILQEVNSKLAKSVGELASTNKQLQDALESQKLFIACVSHEFRNPLNVLLGNVEILESEIDNPDHSQRLKACKICGEALLGQINNLLDVAKIQAGKLEINETLTKMSSFLERVWTLAKAGLEKKGLTGNLSVDKNLPLYLNIDAERLHQILDNLLSNAIKFTSAGSVRVNIQWIKGQHKITEGTLSGLLQEVSENSTISREENNLSLADLDEGKRKSFRAHPQYRKNDLLHLNDFISLGTKRCIKEELEGVLIPRSTEEYSILKIEVSDSGCGIPQEAQQKLFNPFIQADRSITRKYGGTGLGLYIAKILLEKMHGIIKMHSMQDIGTHFEIYLPLKPVTAPVTLNNSANSSQSISKTMPRRISKRQSQSCSFKSPSEMTTPMTGTPQKVLIVDDDASNILILKSFFSKLKIEVDVANNGLEGFNTFCENMGDYLAIAMDIQMSIMDGITAAKKIRKYENSQGIKKTPIIFITGNCTQDEQSECLISKEIGESQFFKKPFRFSDCKLCLQRIHPKLISDF